MLELVRMGEGWAPCVQEPPAEASCLRSHIETEIIQLLPVHYAGQELSATLPPLSNAADQEKSVWSADPKYALRGRMGQMRMLQSIFLIGTTHRNVAVLFQSTRGV